MEFEDVREQTKWEARRVAAAFEVEAFSWRVSFGHVDYKATDGDLRVEWRSRLRDGQLVQVNVGRGRPSCMVTMNEEGLGECHPHYFCSKCNERMMCGLCRLGIEDEIALAPIKCQLSAHEKLELRLSLPREFWPKKWLEEEDK